uniref:Uncharacterized protein n=1 Tax=Mycena chlorophos TaxID=658473 RepID=A0ABQ0L264_MYCCL|nr:predicted protein [Mycena chlorophos]
MSFVLLLSFFAFDGVHAQTLYGIAAILPSSNQVLSQSLLFAPVATGTGPTTTWVAQEVVSYDVLTFSDAPTQTIVNPSAPATLAYSFVPTPGGLQATVGAPLTITTASATFTLAPHTLSCTFDGSSFGVCEIASQFLDDAGTSLAVQSGATTLTLPAIPITTLSTPTPTPTSGREYHTHTTILTAPRIAGIATCVGVLLVSLLGAGVWVCLRRRRRRRARAHRGRDVEDADAAADAETSAIPSNSTVTISSSDSEGSISTRQLPNGPPSIKLSLDSPTSLERGTVASQAEAMRKVSFATARKRVLVEPGSEDRVSVVLEQMRAMAERMTLMEARLNAGEEGGLESPPEYTRAG